MTIVKSGYRVAALAASLAIGAAGPVTPREPTPVYTLGIADADAHLFAVTLDAASTGRELVLVMPTWTPGYYQRMDYADKVRGFRAQDAAGRTLRWRREGNRWHVAAPRGTAVHVSYQVLADRDFVAANFLDADKGYVSPAGMFAYPEGTLRQPVKLRVLPRAGWSVATGLMEQEGVYRAGDFDILYDSPILMGRLERLPSFAVKGVPHHVVGVGFGTLDRGRLVDDLRRIVVAATTMMGDIPYRDYSFLAIGNNPGGIEHLNSAAVGLAGVDNRSVAGRLRLDSFLAHEYFHHYNVKRIRPIELGPFDYERENRTRLLWVSEGLTVYYEWVLLRRAGLMDDRSFFDDIAKSMRAYENEPGRLHQSLAQASYETWEDGPFGRKDDPFNKTISYYDKGPVVGFMLDLAIRHATGNARSLDDVMRALYNDYYRQRGRGFTDREFRATCERIAGVPLASLFTYVDTTAPPDYARYFGYAGLAIDTRLHPLPGGWLGIRLGRSADQADRVVDVEWDSPAWRAGIRRGDRVLHSDRTLTEPVLVEAAPGATVSLAVEREGKQQRLAVTLAVKQERRFTLTPTASPDALQRAIRLSF